MVNRYWVRERNTQLDNPITIVDDECQVSRVGGGEVSSVKFAKPLLCSLLDDLINSYSRLDLVFDI